MAAFEVASMLREAAQLTAPAVGQCADGLVVSLLEWRTGHEQ